MGSVQERWRDSLCKIRQCALVLDCREPQETAFATICSSVNLLRWSGVTLQFNVSKVIADGVHLGTGDHVLRVIGLRLSDGLYP